MRERQRWWCTNLGAFDRFLEFLPHLLHKDVEGVVSAVVQLGHQVLEPLDHGHHVLYGIRVVLVNEDVKPKLLFRVSSVDLGEPYPQSREGLGLGVQLDGGEPFCCLLYADDICLAAKSAKDLQVMLDVMCRGASWDEIYIGFQANLNP